MAQIRVTDGSLNKLFPVPAPAPSPQAPGRFPGISPDSTAALQSTLRENHTKWHIFFNDKRFHNHASHQLLAIYHLGANRPLIQAAYETHASYMRPSYESPEPITDKNFHEHLGDEKFYDAYLKFFTATLLEKGAAATLEEYVFSPKANIEPPKAGEPPLQMANRFLSGLLHPLIHTGYGAEFGLLGMFAEGLAETAVHHVTAPALTHPSLMQYATAVASDAKNATMSRLTSLVPALVLEQFGRATQAQPVGAPSKNVHALSLVARLLKDDFWSYKTIGLPPPKDGEEDTSLERVLHLRGDQLVEMMKEWTVDGTDAEQVRDKIDELFWTSVVIYAVGGWGGRLHSKSGQFNGDFFFVHLVTSVLFLPSLVAYLSPTSTTILLRTYLLNTLALYVARGRPALPVADFFASVTPTPAPPAPASRGSSVSGPGGSGGTLVPDDPNPNPWLALLQNTVGHADDHLCKLQRALAHFAALHGAAPAGHLAALGVELDGAEAVDGTLFVRAAGLSMDRLGWVREGGAEGEWDFEGFFHD